MHIKYIIYMYLIIFVRKRKTLLLSGFSKVKTRQNLKTESRGKEEYQEEDIYKNYKDIYKNYDERQTCPQTEEREREREEVF